MKAVSVKLTIEQKCNVITIHDRLNLCTEKRNPTRIKSTALNKNYFEISIFAVISSTFSLLKVKSFRYLSKKKSIDIIHPLGTAYGSWIRYLAYDKFLIYHFS